MILHLFVWFAHDEGLLLLLLCLLAQADSLLFNCHPLLVVIDILKASRYVLKMNLTRYLCLFLNVTMHKETHLRTEGGKGGEILGKAGIEFYF